MADIVLLTVADVAERLKVSRSKVYKMIEQGKLPVYRIDGVVRVSEEDLAKYLQSCHEISQNPRQAPPVKLRYLSL